MRSMLLALDLFGMKIWPNSSKVTSISLLFSERIFEVLKITASVAGNNELRVWSALWIFLKMQNLEIDDEQRDLCEPYCEMCINNALLNDMLDDVFKPWIV